MRYEVHIRMTTTVVVEADNPTDAGRLAYTKMTEKLGEGGEEVDWATDSYRTYEVNDWKQVATGDSSDLFPPDEDDSAI